MALRKRSGLRVNQTELAKILGYSQNRISSLRAESNDFPVLDTSGKSHIFDTAEVIQWFIEQAIRKRAGLPDNPDNDDPVENRVKYNQTVERARFEKLRADEKEIDVNVKLGKLLPVSLVVQIFQALVGTARSRLLSIHATVRDRYPEIGDEVMEGMQNLIHEALSELGDPDAGLPEQLRDGLAQYNANLATAPETDGE